MIIGIPYNKINVLPLVDGVMIDYHTQKTKYILSYDDESRFTLEQHGVLIFYSASSLKQQSIGRHVASLGNIIPISSKPVFAP
jgi:hypothetical protein